MYCVRSVFVAPIIFTLSFVFVTGNTPINDECDNDILLPECPELEVPTKCKYSCPPDTCDTLWIAYKCDSNQKCSSGCTCEKGYLRTNRTGVCIPKSKCLPPECADDPNAILSCRKRRTCADSKDENEECPEDNCTWKSCDCKPGFVYDPNFKKCVTPNDCTLQCTRPHERYSACVLADCSPKTCNQLGKPVLCVSLLRGGPCKADCLCENNYVRNSKGICIKKEECPSCGGDPNAVSGCGNHCGKSCSDYNKGYLIKCANYCEFNGCDCRNNTVYDHNIQKCVEIKDCTPICGAYEEYSSCGRPCAEPSCENPNPPECLNKKCKAGCFCIKGSVRDFNNLCIPVDKCPPKCTGPHEKYTECLLGQCVYKNCTDIGKPIACPSIAGPCPGGCICEKGYLRNSKGVCIKKEECHQAGCGANQTWVSCNVNCGDAYCPLDDQPQPVCDAPNPCPGGCHCKLNYRLNKTGDCILASECPPVKCTRPHEVWDSCPSACLAENCEDIDNQSTVCNTLVLNCQPRCVCEKGHFRNKDGICVPANECPGRCKDPNAEWKNCPNGPDPCPATCQHTKPVVPCDIPCTSGCQCKEGYVLSKPGGICVEIEKCPEYADCKCNETFVQCTFRCPQVVCPTTDAIILCKPPRDCPGGCGCKPNYRYNENDVCILAQECPPVECTRPNEEWSPCPPDNLVENCSDRGKEDQEIEAEICNPRCICKTGHYKNDNGVCVPEDECP